MTVESIGLFKGMAAKMDYLNERQKVISQNIANADTPGYKPRDLFGADFSRVLDQARGEHPVRTAVTNERHMPRPNEVRGADKEKQDVTYEVAPSGNAVIIEEQMLNASETTMDYNMMTTLYRKNVSMLRMAMSRGQ